MAEFKPSSNMQARVNAIVVPHVTAFSAAVRDQAKVNAPVDTAQLRAGIRVFDPVRNPGMIGNSVGTPLSWKGKHAGSPPTNYSLVVHQGHGPIYPKVGNDRGLRFKQPKRTGVIQIRFSTAAVGPNPYLWNALVSVNSRQPAGLQFKLIPGIR